MRKKRKEALRRELEYITMPFEVAKRRAVDVDGWLRTVRRAQDLSAKEVAERLWVKKREVMRLEVAEVNGAINLLRMRRVAAVMECELVYAFVPKGTTFEEIAERERRCQKVPVGDDAMSVLDMLARAVKEEFRKLEIEWVVS